MESSYCYEITPIISFFLLFFLLFSPVFSTTYKKDIKETNITFDSNNMKLIEATLKKINKPFSEDGDIIDCVLIHFQPTFNNPMLKATMPLDPPEIPDRERKEMESEVKQLWNSNDESCPHGTIPIRRTTESEILRTNSVSMYGKKIRETDISNIGHEHAIGYIQGGKYYGAKGTLNVWAPNVNVTRLGEFSISQIWVITDVPNHGMSTFEAGWQVSPTAYGNSLPRLFTYWTNDGYVSGCYNLKCSGFVQTSHEICLGATIIPQSTYNGSQFDISVLIWKDPRHGNWWLKVGSIIVGYWPIVLFPDLKEHATLIEYGGEVYNTPIEGTHTTTKMGSGHFPNEGYRKASYIRNMGIVDEENTLNPVGPVSVLAEKPNCYNVRRGFDSSVWGYYIFFGGPGNNPNCP
ncbi:hypothetical protein LXL04_020843 [Taraxacum kok-saghyz]